MESASTPDPTAKVIFLDRPVKDFDQDELGRKGFIRSFWKALRNHRADEAVVIGINGPWGDGKTTFKDMVVSLESKEATKKLAFVQFNPWEWASQDQVASAFFKELGTQLRLQSPKGKAGRSGSKLQRGLEKLANALGVVEPIVSGAADLLAMSHPDYASVVSPVAAGIKGTAHAVKSVQGAHKALSSTQPLSVEQVKQEVRCLFEAYRQDSGHVVVVVIDDIDRLAPDEIRQVFQLVKINADFPGLIFLLLYDEDYVVSALRRCFGADGKRFLEKIVQFEVKLPPPPEGALLVHLTSNMQRVLEGHPHYKPLFSADRLKESFDCWLHLHLTNPRNYGRLVSTWTFYLGVFEGKEAEVNPVDLLILEALRHFEPRVFERLATSTAEVFPSQSSIDWEDVGGTEGAPSKHRQLLAAIAGLGESKHVPGLTQLLESLLPEDGRGLGYFASTEAEAALRTRRICHLRNFRRYFRFSIDTGDISDEEIVHLKPTAEKPKEFFQVLDEVETRGALPTAFDKLFANEMGPVAKPAAFLTTLWEWWERRLLKPVDNSPGCLSRKELQDRVIRLQQEILGAIEGKERFRILNLAVKSARCVHSLAQAVFNEDQREHAAEKLPIRDGGGLLTKEQVLNLNEAVSLKILHAFRSAPPPADEVGSETVFWCWSFAGANLHEIGKALMDSAQGVGALLLGTFVRHLHDTGGNGSKYRSMFSKFFDPGILAEKVGMHHDALPKLHPKLQEIPGLYLKFESDTRPPKAS